MIKCFHIEQYRKLKNISISFSPNVNAISGTNGTCKTSLLHLISNSFQAVNKTCQWLNDSSCLQVINAVNAVTNPKVESLTRGDREYNDPAHGIKGSLFSVDYFDRESLDFRRHNSAVSTRYAVKPKYPPGTREKLPYCPVIYLGLSRLVPYGEFQNDEAVAGIKKKLPQKYQDELAQIFKNFTNYEIHFNAAQQMGDIKTRSEFSSNVTGVDSNTISAGEDNLSIILTAVLSLKYYYESIQSEKTAESILLIDEIDATLHPAFQIKLLNLLREMSTAYKIQVVFTTHSMSLIEEMLSAKDNVIYLLDNITSVAVMDTPDIFKIKMHLSSLTHEDIYLDKVIPVFTEDAEARFMLSFIFDFFDNQYDEFPNARRFFHMVDTNISAENLRGIFTDGKLLRTTMRSICILDGDHNTEITNCIITLPGHAAPEKVLFDYGNKLLEEDDPFWVENTVVSRGYSKSYYINKVRNRIEEFENNLQQKHENGDSAKGMRREFNKELFKSNKGFFEMLFKHWLHNPSNKAEIDLFYRNLHTLFLKVSHYHEINPHEWP